MANVSRVNGFTPVQHLTGAPYNGQYRTYSVPASDGTALAVGDAVKLAADGTGSAGAVAGAMGGGNGLKNVIKAAAGDAIVGVVVGFDIVPDSLNTPQYRVGSTLRQVRVADATDLVFLVQVSNGTVTNSIVGENYNLAAGTISTTTGLSGATLDLNAGTPGGATAQFKVLQFDQAPDNEIGTSAKVLVKINNHQYNSGTGTAGV